MTKQDLTKIKQLLDEFLLMLKIWSHKRNNEAEESEQLSKPLLLIFAGTLEMDKPPLFFNKEQMSTLSSLKTSQGELFAISGAAVESIHCELSKHPPSNIWPAPCVYIFIPLLLA